MMVCNGIVLLPCHVSEDLDLNYRLKKSGGKFKQVISQA